MKKVAEILPKVWMYEEAYQSGRGGFRIKVNRIDNPFSKDSYLAKGWLQGWNDASAAEPPVKRRTEYFVEEPDDDNRTRPKRHNSERDTRKRRY